MLVLRCMPVLFVKVHGLIFKVWDGDRGLGLGSRVRVRISV